VAWSTLTGTVSVGVGLADRSLALAGLGFNVLLDVISSMVLIWRFRLERHHQHLAERAEAIAHRVASGALILFGAALAVEATRRLLESRRAHVTALAQALAALSLLVLPVLARAKYRAAAALPSNALRADAHITATSAAMAAVTLLGLLLARSVGWWWADSIAALLLGLAAGGEGARGLAQPNGH
jgi:divalent metal cation (Fe/Co/Zn/Cd) transporter